MSENDLLVLESFDMQDYPYVEPYAFGVICSEGYVYITLEYGPAGLPATLFTLDEFRELSAAILESAERHQSEWG